MSPLILVCFFVAILQSPNNKIPKAEHCYVLLFLLLTTVQMPQA